MCGMKQVRFGWTRTTPWWKISVRQLLYHISTPTTDVIVTADVIVTQHGYLRSQRWAKLCSLKCAPIDFAVFSILSFPTVRCTIKTLLRAFEQEFLRTLSTFRIWLSAFSLSLKLFIHRIRQNLIKCSRLKTKVEKCAIFFLLFF